MNNYENNPIWCTDEGGDIKKYYFLNVENGINYIQNLLKMLRKKINHI